MSIDQATENEKSKILIKFSGIYVLFGDFKNSTKKHIFSPKFLILRVGKGIISWIFKLGDSFMAFWHTSSGNTFIGASNQVKILNSLLTSN